MEQATLMNFPEILVDLDRDYLEWLREKLQEMAVPLPANVTELAEVSYVYWNARKRYIPPRPRAVHLAREFRMPAEKEDNEGATKLRRMFEAGTNVNPFLSRYAKKPAALPKKGEKPKANPFYDGLLNEWGIQHFHWDDGTDTSKPRSSQMLFAIVNPNDVYFIDVLAHGHWSKQDLVERVHLNWPSLLKHRELRRQDKVPGSERLTDEQVSALRRKGYSTVYTARDGTAYLPPGGGQVSAGIGVDVVTAANRAAGVISHWNARMKASHESIVDLFERNNAPIPESVILKLKIDEENTIHVFEPNLGFSIALGPLFPNS